MRDTTLPVLIVGAGPTGLALAAQLTAFGVPFRIVDRSLDRAHESRAAAVQARTLEMLQPYGLADTLVARGRSSAHLQLHFEGGRTAEVTLGRDVGEVDTRYPFILFVSQAETEAVLGEHLAARGATIERGVELLRFDARAGHVDVALRKRAGGEERIRVQYLVGCDGAHSTVRKAAGIEFHGDAYVQDFVLGDVELDPGDGARPLASNTVHSFPGRYGVAMIFPLGTPATWRVIAMSTRAGTARVKSPAGADQPIMHELSLAELQSALDDAAAGTLRARDPAWLARFHLHHRQASHYRAGRVFLAGDAAHIHSPVGGQGMNTGMQDAWNLGWKLALVVAGKADPTLLDTYEAERWPVGRALLRYTDRVFALFTRAMSSGAVVAWARRTVIPRAVPPVLRSTRLRAIAFRFVSELGIAYRQSAAAVEGTPKLDAGPRAGERLPDAEVVRGEHTTTLQRELGGPCMQLLLCGSVADWRERTDMLRRLHDRYGVALKISRLERSTAGDDLLDPTGAALARLGVRENGLYVVRPDGYIGYRCAGTNLRGAERWLARWLVDVRRARTG